MAKSPWSSIGDTRRAAEIRKAFSACLANGTVCTVKAMKPAIYELLHETFYLNLIDYKTCDGFWKTKKNSKCLAVLTQLVDDKNMEYSIAGRTQNPDGTYTDPSSTAYPAASTGGSKTMMWFLVAAAAVIGLVLFLKFRK